MTAIGFGRPPSPGCALNQMLIVNVLEIANVVNATGHKMLDLFVRVTVGDKVRFCVCVCVCVCVVSLTAPSFTAGQGSETTGWTWWLRCGRRCALTRSVTLLVYRPGSW